MTGGIFHLPVEMWGCLGDGDWNAVIVQGDIYFMCFDHAF
jgi:hypothetical protein